MEENKNTQADNQNSEQKELQWTTNFPGVDGWYWLYQAIPDGKGETTFPVYVNTAAYLPPYIKLFYGPITAPEIPNDMKPLEYQKNAAQEEADNGETNGDTITVE